MQKALADFNGALNTANVHRKLSSDFTLLSFMQTVLSLVMNSLSVPLKENISEQIRKWFEIPRSMMWLRGFVMVVWDGKAKRRRESCQLYFMLSDIWKGQKLPRAWYRKLVDLIPRLNYVLRKIKYLFWIWCGILLAVDTRASIM